MQRLRTWSLVLLMGAAIGLAGCGGSSSSSSTTTTAATKTTAGHSATSPMVGIIPVPDRSPAGTFGTAPTVAVPPGAPATQLESADLILGTGATAKTGDNVTVQYVLATYSTGKVIQSSWTSQPFTFELGESGIIPGWNDGVVGMKVGGRRELIIPPSLGYGADSPGAGIAPNDTLVFVIDLLKAN